MTTLDVFEAAILFPMRPVSQNELPTPVVNFINILRTRFSYENAFLPKRN